MPKLIYAESFVEDASHVVLPTKRAEIRHSVELLADFPELGSALLPRSIKALYGNKVRKLAVNPFEVIYEYSADDEAVYLLGIIHQRSAW